ncbi:MAG TPA: T9SS type A sorting domain-containing protein [Bacteroidia bacterium]|nr:T9SS type A sorting domain-containing protein [Bacteroidia bacterium]
MIKLYFTTILLILIVRSSTAQFYTQYFDGADTIFNNSVNVFLDTSSSNIWQIGTPQKIIFNSAATLPNAIVTDTINNYPMNNTSIFRIKIYNQFVPWGIMALQWKQKLDMDADYDGGIVEFSIDSGNTWQNAFNNPFVYNFYGFQVANQDTLTTGEYAFSGTDSTWRDIWLCFDLSWMNFNPDTIRFRFNLKSDSVDNNKEGWMIDNMMAHVTMIHTVKDVNQTSYLNVYPNPANNIIHIEAEKLMEFHIIEHMELVNPQGKAVEQWKNIPTKFWFDAGKYEDGIYLLKIKTNIRSETVPVIVRKQ